MQTMNALVAASQVADRHEAAAASRNARRSLRARRNNTEAHISTTPPIDARVVLRPAQLQDGAAVAQLAALDDAARPKGDLLVAELDGRIVAAVPLDGGRAIADPFRRTADLVELLRSRAVQLNGTGARSSAGLGPRLWFGRA